jgi:F420H(2)-dependent quinone reductase
VQTFQLTKFPRWWEWILVRINPSHIDRSAALTEDLRRIGVIAAAGAPAAPASTTPLRATGPCPRRSGRSFSRPVTDLLNGIPRVDPTSEPSIMRRSVARVLTTTPGSAIHRMFIAPLDTRLMHMTDGRFHLAKGTIPLVLLRTTGARSGVERVIPLAYFTDGDDVILIASNYGQACSVVIAAADQHDNRVR